ncbi:MAG: hypothetical protein VYC19_10490 [Pseudomonadota bacterium]|jgi:hypothetical protein|nr:hypothetical protein [Pseudomonadota bacterium]MEC9234817.1 hypothetical protein [Pseudomonadota bacterium]MEE3322348.1 hypothetical protein [Pseudomonadota bacterium]
MKYIAMRRYEYIKAAIFSLTLLTCTFIIMCYAFSQNRYNIVLGSELNANGTVEYMCLGSGCDVMNRMTWHDK